MQLSVQGMQVIKQWSFSLQPAANPKVILPPLELGDRPVQSCPCVMSPFILRFMTQHANTKPKTLQELHCTALKEDAEKMLMRSMVCSHLPT